MFNFPLNFSSYRCMLAYEAAQMRISAILNGEFVCSVQVVASIEIEGLECVVGHVTRNNHGDSKW